jgi:endoglycosylceramidase
VLVPFLVGKPCSFSADLSLTHALDESRRNGDALFMTEMGATDDLANFADYVNGANALGISWTYWAYTGFDPTTTGTGDTQALVLDPTRPPAGANVKTEKLALLAQPYATVTAGTPRRWAFDAATHGFRYVYRTKPAGKGKKFGKGAITKLSLPAIQYPAGYRVRIKGARVLSQPRARVLLVTRCGRAKQVEVAVTPGKFRAAARKCR